MRSILLLVLVGCASTQAPGDGFTPLFNGRDLTGWVNVNGGPETWSVRDGEIVTSGHPSGVLRSDRMYENFILELDWKHMKDPGNSGLFLHSGALPTTGNCFTKAFEVQIMLGDDPKGLWTRHGDVFAIQGATFVPDRPHPQGWPRCLPSENRVKGAGQWNHYRVTSKDGSIKLEVNGKEVSGGSQCHPRKGYLCLESEGGECHFRNLRIQEIVTSHPGTEEIAEADQGYRCLYGGDFRNWITDPGPADAWSPKDWVFEGSGKGDYLLTREKFDEFMLIVDWRSRKKGTAALQFVGRLAVKLESEKPDQWHRVQATVKRNHIQVVQDGTTIVDKSDVLPAKDSIGLSAVGAPVQFANVFVKELK